VNLSPCRTFVSIEEVLTDSLMPVFNFEEEPPAYDMDTEDEEWLTNVNRTASDARCALS
jgi:hypothetical protein